MPFAPYLLLFCSFYFTPPARPPAVSLLLMLCDREFIPYMPSRLSSVSLLTVLTPFLSVSFGDRLREREEGC